MGGVLGVHGTGFLSHSHRWGCSLFSEARPGPIITPAGPSPGWSVRSVVRARSRAATRAAARHGRLAAQVLPMPCSSLSITWSTVKLAAFCRGGYSTKVIKKSPTIF